MIHVTQKPCCLKRAAWRRGGGGGALGGGALGQPFAPGQAPSAADLKKTADYYAKQADDAAKFAEKQYGATIQAATGLTLAKIQESMTFPGTGVLTDKGKELVGQSALWASKNADAALAYLHDPQVKAYVDLGRTLASAVYSGKVGELIRNTAQVGVQAGAKYAGEQVTAFFASTLGGPVAGVLGGIAEEGIKALFAGILTPAPDFSELCVWSNGGDPFSWKCRKRVVGMAWQMSSIPDAEPPRGAGQLYHYVEDVFRRKAGTTMWDADALHGIGTAPILLKWPDDQVYCKSKSCLAWRLRYMDLWRAYWANSPFGVRAQFAKIQRSDEAASQSFESTCLPQYRGVPVGLDCDAMIRRETTTPGSSARYYFYTMYAWRHMVQAVLDKKKWKWSDWIDVSTLPGVNPYEIESAQGRTGVKAKKFPAPKAAAALLGLRALSGEDLQDEWDQFYHGDRGPLFHEKYGLLPAWSGFWSGEFGQYLRSKPVAPYIPGWQHAANVLALREAARQAADEAKRAAEQAYGPDAPQTRASDARAEDAGRAATGATVGLSPTALAAIGIGAVTVLGGLAIATRRR